MLSDYEELAAYGADPVIRGNAFSAARSRVKGQYCPTLLVQAQIGESRGKTVLLVDAWPLFDKQDKILFVYIDDDGSTVIIEYRVPSYDKPVANAGCFGFVALVERQEIRQLIGLSGEDGAVAMISGAELKEKLQKEILVLPRDTSIAVGFGFPDGAFSNFIEVVPVAHPECWPRKAFKRAPATVPHGQ